MNLTAIFPAGLTSMTVNGLHQWDYGRGLSIVADGLPALVEVHFSCAGMTEAPVRVAEVTNNNTTATVHIPDQCLEQTTPITAWVYLKNDVSGRTAMEVTLPIIPRAKPAAVGTPDDEARAATKYDELFSLTERVLEDYEGVDADIQAVADAAASASASASSASASASSAGASKSEAATSASNAATSETNAAASASSAAASASSAAASASTSAESAVLAVNSFNAEERYRLLRAFGGGQAYYERTFTSGTTGCTVYALAGGQMFRVSLDYYVDGGLYKKYDLGVLYWDGQCTVESVPVLRPLGAGGTSGEFMYVEIQPDPNVSGNAVYSKDGSLFRRGLAKLYRMNVDADKPADRVVEDRGIYKVTFTSLTQGYVAP